MVLLRSSAFALVLTGLVHADAVKLPGITPLSPIEIASYTAFTNFASTAYCDPSSTLHWTCGPNCQANPDFMSVASGGEGAATQFWYVGFSPSQNTVIVAHQGTNPKQIFARLTDEDILLFPLDADLFPGVPPSVLVHEGFALQQASTAPKILSYVNQTLAEHGASSVTIVGHSLGAAIALLDGVYLRGQLNESVNVRVIGYGMPRVGNQDFANWVDKHLSGQVTHINNQEDPIPILPSIIFHYHHPSGAVHITDAGIWVSCPGQDNPSTQCIVAALGINLANHDGPYDNIKMGCSQVQKELEAEPVAQVLLNRGKGFSHQVLSHFRNFVF